MRSESPDLPKWETDTNYKLFISIAPIQPYNNWLSKVALHIIVDIEKVRSQHIHIAYRLEHFEHIGFKLALKGLIVCYASQMVGQCVR